MQSNQILSNFQDFVNFANTNLQSQQFTAKLGAGVFTFNSPILINKAFNHSICGETPVTTKIVTLTPTISYKSDVYSITISVEDVSIFTTGDWIVVKTIGTNLNTTNYNTSQNNTRHFELSGVFEITNVDIANKKITYKSTHKQHPDYFPGGANVNINTITPVGGTITKFPTVLKFNSCTGFEIKEYIKEIKDIIIVGNNQGINSFGIQTTENGKIGNLFNVGIANFSGSAINAQGQTAINGSNVYSSGHDSHAFRVDGARVTIPFSIATGCGGNGYFVTNGGYMMCSNSIATGMLYSGFIPNRGSTMISENCVAINNGNCVKMPLEGRGYECEASSTQIRNNSVGLWNTSINFYSNSASTSSSNSCLAIGSIVSHGFYATQCSRDSTRNSVSIDNKSRGFYAYLNSSMYAQDSLASNNAGGDYVAQGSSDITAHGYRTYNQIQPTFNVAINSNGANKIITVNTFELYGSAKLSMPPIRGANLVILNKSIEIDSQYHVIDIGSSTGDNELTTIKSSASSSFEDGQTLILRSLSSLRDVTILSDVGNINLWGSNNITLSHWADRIMLQYDGAAKLWVQIAFSDNKI